MRDAFRWILQQQGDFWPALRAQADAIAEHAGGQSS